MFSSSKKDWLIYSIYGLVLLIYIFISDKLLIMLDNIANSTYNSMPLNIVSMFIFIILGMLIGINHLFSEVKKQGIWKINLAQLILIAVLPLYFVLSCIILLLKIDLLTFLVSKQLMGYILRSSIIGIILEILLGYALISSLYKTRA